jgi:two-component system, NarL family, nitrate/nitrite response regulator NarL
MLDRSPKVIVVDDHDLFRKNLVKLLKERGIAVIGEAALASEGIRQAIELHPDVVVMELSMPGMSGIEATQRLAAAAPLTRVLVLTVVADDRSVLESLLAGACGYMLKDASIDEIVAGLWATARGESMISPRVASRLVARLRGADATEPLDGSGLTPREREILELLARGLDNAEIAEMLSLSQHTVKNYVSSILVKLQVENRIQAAVRAVRGGIV